MKLWTIILIIITIGTVTSCGTKEDTNNEEETLLAKPQYQKINAEKAKEYMLLDNVIILDVRTQEEYQAGYIPNAVLLPVDQLMLRAEAELPKDATILIYCRSGNRSKTASNTLLSLGYTNVYDFGGILDWTGEIVKE